MLEINDIYKKAAEKLEMSEEEVAFIMNDFFNALKKVIKYDLILKFWKGVIIGGWLTIVVSPKFLLRKRKYYLHALYLKKKKDYYKRLDKIKKKKNG